MNELENPLNYRNINKTDSGQKMNATNSIYQCTKCEVMFIKIQLNVIAQ